MNQERLMSSGANLEWAPGEEQCRRRHRLVRRQPWRWCWAATRRRVRPTWACCRPPTAHRPAAGIRTHERCYPSFLINSRRLAQTQILCKLESTAAAYVDALLYFYLLLFRIKMLLLLLLLLLLLGRILWRGATSWPWPLGNLWSKVRTRQWKWERYLTWGIFPHQNIVKLLRGILFLPPLSNYN